MRNVIVISSIIIILYDDFRTVLYRLVSVWKVSNPCHIPKCLQLIFHSQFLKESEVASGQAVKETVERQELVVEVTKNVGSGGTGLLFRPGLP